MHLVEILLPLADYAGRPFPKTQYVELRRELTEGFGGVTVFSQGVAEGFWENEAGTSRDEILIFEVMCEKLDEGWWRERRKRLERDFRQDEIIIRARAIRLL